MLLLALVVAATAAPHTVAVDMSALEEPAHRKLGGVELERRAVLRLVQDGFAVVALSANPEIVLRVRSAGSSLSLVAVAGTRELGRTVPVGRAPLPELHLEVAQKLTELAQDAVRLLPPPAPPAPPDAGGDAGTAAPIPDAGPPPPPVVVVQARAAELDLGASALWRDGPVDPVFRIDFRYELAARLRFHLGLGLSPSGAPGVHIYEQQLLAGVAYALYDAAPLQVELGVQVGGLLHVYALDDPTLNDPAGLRLDGLFELPLVISYRPGGRFTVSAFAAPGSSTRARIHELSGQEVWVRSALRLEAGGAVGWRF